MNTPACSNVSTDSPATLQLGDREIRRLGYGAMRLPGPDVWGEPDDPTRARAVLRRAVDLGVNFIDTAWFYGPFVANRLIYEALHPYPRDLVIATKLGVTRLHDKGWAPAARPDELRQGVEHDLRTLHLERLDVVHLRFMPRSGVPLTESIDALIAMQAEGKIRHLGLSSVDAGQIAAALARVPIVAVQNFFGIGGGAAELAKRVQADVDAPEAVLDLCTARGIAFVPFFPSGLGRLSQQAPALSAIAASHGVSSWQIALAWLLARSPVMLPIPGTRSLVHLEENWNAQRVVLSPEERTAIQANDRLKRS